MSETCHTMTLSVSQETDPIQTKRTHLLYQHLTIGIVATSINALVLGLVLWSRVAHVRLISWLSTCELIALLRYKLLLRYRKSEVNNGGKHWAQWFFLGTIASGICWGQQGSSYSQPIRSPTKPS